jgi:8-oxo-dGTP pyrophosphatase MutT (NUDIX family)
MPRGRVLPEELVAHARRFVASGAAPVDPRHAATVILLRDAPGGLEAYLLRRVGSMAFAGGMYAYPGGGVDVRDSETSTAWAGPTAEEWAARLGCDARFARALVCAAVRETFEESGVLLAGPSAGAVVADVSDAGWERERIALEARESSLSELLRQHRLVLRSDLLRPWARWVTPEPEPRRYDARFFVAALPGGQATREVGGEADRVVWLRPADALRAVERGVMQMLPPTSATLEEIAAYDTVADVLAAANARQLAPITPRIMLDESGGRVLLPGEF